MAGVFYGFSDCPLTYDISKMRNFIMQRILFTVFVVYMHSQQAA